MRQLIGLALTLTLGVQSFAQEPASARWSKEAGAVLDRVDAIAYSPWSHIDELSAGIKLNGFALPGAIRYLWRKNGVSELTIQGADNQALEVMFDSLLREKTLDPMMLNLLLAPFSVKFRDCDVTVSRDGDLYKIDARHDGPHPEYGFERELLWVDRRYVPVRLHNEMHSPILGKYLERTELSYREVRGRWVLQSARTESDLPSMPPVQLVEFDWQEINGTLLVSKMSIFVPKDDTRLLYARLQLVDILLDQGLGQPERRPDSKVLALGEARTATLLDTDSSPDLDNEALLAAQSPKRRFSIDVDRPGPVTVRIRAFSFDPVLTVYSADREMLHRTADTTIVAAATIAVPGPGRWAVEVTSSGGLPGDFEIACTHGNDQPPLSTAEIADGVSQLVLHARQEWFEGRYLAGKLLASRALSFAGEHLASGSVAEGMARLTLGQCLDELGHPERALDEVGRSIEILDTTTSLLAVNAACARAEMLRRQDRFNEASRDLQRALAQMSHVKDWAAAGIRSPLLATLGRISLEQARPEEATEYLEQAVAESERTVGEADGDTLAIRHGLAMAYQARGRADDAMQVIDDLSRIARARYGDDAEAVLAAAVFKGRLQLAAGDAALAESTLTDAAVRLEQKHGIHNYATIVALANAARARLHTGDAAGARQTLERILPAAARIVGEQSALAAWIHDDLADSLAHLGDQDAAIGHRIQAAANSRGILSRELTALTESDRLRWAATLRGRVHRLVSAVAGSDSPQTADAYEEVRRWKGLVSRGLLRERAWIQKDADPDLRALVFRLRRTVARLSASHFDPGGVDRTLAMNRPPAPDGSAGSPTLDRDGARVSPGALPEAARFEELIAERKRLEEEIARRTVLASSTGKDDLREVRQTVGDDAALLDFVLIRGGETDRAAVFVVRKKEPVRLVDLGPASELQEEIERHLAVIRSSRLQADGRGVAVASTSENARASRVRELLWQPISGHLGNVKRVFVCPEAELATLPFETIPGPEHGTFLLEQYGFVYLQSTTDLLRAQQRPRNGGRLVLVGGLDYDAVRRDEPALRTHPSGEPAVRASWPALPGTGREIMEIAGLYEREKEYRADILTGAAGSEDRLRTAVRGARFVHLATHGFFAPEGTALEYDAPWTSHSPDRDFETSGPRAVPRQHSLPGVLSGIILAGANVATSVDNDGILTSEEAAWLDLGSCDMVVLSACDTGLGTPSAGESLIGLRRSLYLAGAKTRVTSLWKVDDDRTVELMRDFHERLLSGRRGRYKALRDAQLAMLERNRSEAGDALPYTWGAFVLEGEWD